MKSHSKNTNQQNLQKIEVILPHYIEMTQNRRNLTAFY